MGEEEKARAGAQGGRGKGVRRTTAPGGARVDGGQSIQSGDGDGISGGEIPGEGCEMQPVRWSGEQRECGEVRKLWELVLRKWHAKTGERLAAGDEWITAWGARWCEWKDEQEQAEHQQTEEAWRVAHAATVIAIREEYQRKKPRKATQMFVRVQALVEEMVRQRRRWATEKVFGKAWEATGMVARGRGDVRITMWDERRRERGAAGSGSGQVLDAMPAVGGDDVAEIYTDGTGGKKQSGVAGWGWTRVAGGKEVETACGPVITSKEGTGHIGAEKHSNNTGELSAIYWAIRGAEAAGVREVVIRYDSQYAAGMARGLWQPKSNKDLIRAVRNVVRSTGVTIWWKHVKGHSGHKWNDRADELAEEGARQTNQREKSQGGEDERQGKQNRKQREEWKGGQEEREVAPEVERTRGIRRLTYNANEVERVLRACTRHGVLNTTACRKQSIRGEEIERRRQRCLHEVARAGEEPEWRKEEARARVDRAARELVQGATRRAEERARKRVKCTEVLHVPINAVALQKLVAEEGERDAGPGQESLGEGVGRGRGATVRSVAEMVQALRQAVEQTEDGEPECDGEGHWRLKVAYKHCKRGRDMIEAGHITGAREYAIGIDPFKWNRRVRGAALKGVATGLDDNAAYIRIRMALVAEGKEICERFLRNRECVLGGYGEKLLGEEAADVRRKRMKRVTCGYDMDSGPDAWAKVYGNPHSRTIVGMTVQLCDGKCKHKEGARADGNGREMVG